MVITPSTMPPNKRLKASGDTAVRLLLEGFMEEALTFLTDFRIDPNFKSSKYCGLSLVAAGLSGLHRDPDRTLKFLEAMLALGAEGKHSALTLSNGETISLADWAALVDNQTPSVLTTLSGF